jgi:hypothetical protein
MTQTPMKEIASPISAKREGTCLNKRIETSIEKNGTVLTKTVAFRIVVSLSAAVKNTKWRPMKTLRTNSSLAFFLTSPNWDVFSKTTDITIKARQAMVNRQNTIDRESKYCTNLTKIAAVPKRTPAVTPSTKAVFLVRTRIPKTLSVTQLNQTRLVA